MTVSVGRVRPRARAVGLIAVLSATSLAIGASARAQEDPPPDLTATPLAPDDTITADKSLTSRIAETDPALVGRTDSTPVEVLVKLDYDSVATYQGSIDGLAPTSPSVTGDSLTGETNAERAYDGFVEDQETAFLDQLAEVAPDAQVGQSLRTVYGGVAVTVPANTVDEILAIDNVVAVQKDELNQLLTDESTGFIGADSVYPALGGDRRAGTGVIFGVLDSGAWPEHPSFQDQGHMQTPPRTFNGQPRACNFGDNPLTPANDPFACNNKLIGGQAFLDTYLSNPTRPPEPFRTARDSNGHGTHTGSTTAGNVLDSAEVFGVERGPINGVAPGAWVSVYKVCGIQGCVASDSAAAVGQAILDGVNVINFSISGGTNPTTDPVELAFLDAYAAGVFVATSAGNNGPGAGTANHLSPWTATVAASTQTREFQSTLTVTGTGGATATFVGASITAGVTSPLPIVMSSAAPYSRPLCDAPAPAGTFTGKIVACQRGVNARVEKGFNVLQGGAAGMVLYNPALADKGTDNHWLPTVHLADGTQFVAFMNANPGATASFTAGAKADGQGDVIAAFSSRGPAGDFIKPDITAPGVQVLAGHTPVPNLEGILGGPPGEFFQAIAGTSMSSPHIAGSAILMKALHPSWTPGQIKSALMTTATTEVVKQNLTTAADPFDMGAGRVQVDVAGNPGLTFDASAADMIRLGTDPLNAIHLNVPSINAPTMPGRITTTRVATNVSGGRLRYDISATAPDGSSITVSPNRITLNNGQSAELDITIESTADPGQFFGEIQLVPRESGFPTLHLPVAFVTEQGAVSLEQDCNPTEILKSNTTLCTIEATNLGAEATTVDLTTSVNRNLRLTQATGATLVDGEARLTTELVGDRPGIPDVGAGALFGFVPLGGPPFNIAPVAVGDETMVNFNVPAYNYNGRTYNRIGVTSNGYLVAGGGTVEDLNCCTLPDGPDPSRPNNILAPFWTDLNGTGAEGIRAATLQSGTNVWLVVEWHVNVFGTTDVRRFQTWIGLAGDTSPAQDITFAYLAAQADPAGHDFLVGAENELGEGDVTSFLPSGSLRVTSTNPTPGGSASYTVVARGERVGTGTVTTEMFSEHVPGVTVVRTDVVVNRR